MPISSCVPVNPSTLTFPNTNLRKTIGNLLVVLKIAEKWLNNLYYISLMRIKIIFLFDVSFSVWPGNSVSPNFPQYQPERHNNKFNYCLEIQ